MKKISLIAVLFLALTSVYAQTGAMGTSPTGTPSSPGSMASPTGTAPGTNTSGSTMDTTPTIGGGARHQQKMENSKTRSTNGKTHSTNANSNSASGKSVED